MDLELKRQILSYFKMRGYCLSMEAVKVIIDVISSVSIESHQSTLEKLVDAAEKLQLSSNLLDTPVIQLAIQECAQQIGANNCNEFMVIDSFSLPKFEYDVDRKKFISRQFLELSELDIHGDSNDKAALYIDRYWLVYQKTLRHPLFSSKPADISDNANQSYKLRTVESLLCCTSRQQDVVVLGMLTQLKEDKFFLEDPTGVVLLNLVETKFHVGLFCENTIILVEGYYEDNVLFAKGIGFPPDETAEKTRLHFGNINFFGGSASAKNSDSLLRIEQKNQDAMFVFLADIWLDQPKVMKSLRKLFFGYADFPPFCFVLCGSFVSSPYGSDYLKKISKYFKELADIILEYPSLVQNSHFVFVPSMQDPLLANILPRPSLPISLASVLKQKLPKCHLATNPCRIQYCTQEIIVFRQDLTHKMCRNAIRMPTAKQEISHHLVKTVLSQSHLTPLPLHVSSVYWSFDYALRLYPLPDLLVIADEYDPYTIVESGCTVMNPGSFARNSFAFKAYVPATRKVEDSVIPTD